MDKSLSMISCISFVVIFGSLIVSPIIPYASIVVAQSSLPVENETAPSGIDWNTLCTDVSQMNILLQPCSDLVNSNGTLTSTGNATMSCITSGLSLGLEALHHGVPLSKVIFGLGLLAQPTGCGEWINMNSVDSASQFQFLTQAFNLH